MKILHRIHQEIKFIASYTIHEFLSKKLKHEGLCSQTRVHWSEKITVSLCFKILFNLLIPFYDVGMCSEVLFYLYS